MKILFINNLGTIHGGAETMIVQLRRGLIARGHKVRILAGDEQGNGEDIADYKFKTFKGNSPLKIFYVFNPFAIISLLKALRTYKPDIVHLHNTSKASPFILPLLKNYPTILTIHDHMVFDPTRINATPLLAPYKKSLGDYFIDSCSLRFFLERLRFFFFRRFLKNINLVLACSNFYAQCAKDSGMFRNVKVLHNGIILLEQKPIEHWEHLLYVGRLDEAKGVETLLEAIPEIREKYPNIKLNIVGAGNQEAQLKCRAEKLGICESVQFFGHLPHAEVIKQYQETTLVIVPSLFPDNFPTVCIEAMAAGRPVIASKVGGIPELIIDGETGILFDSGKSKELAKKIIEVLNDRKNIQRMSHSGPLEAKQEFDAEDYTDKTENKYFDLIETKI